MIIINQPFQANNGPDSSSSDEFFIDGSSNKEEYDSYHAEMPISGRSEQVIITLSYY